MLPTVHSHSPTVHSRHTLRLFTLTNSPTVHTHKLSDCHSHSPTVHSPTPTDQFHSSLTPLPLIYDRLAAAALVVQVQPLKCLADLAIPPHTPIPAPAPIDQRRVRARRAVEGAHAAQQARCGRKRAQPSPPCCADSHAPLLCLHSLHLTFTSAFASAFAFATSTALAALTSFTPPAAFRSARAAARSAAISAALAL